MGERTEDGGARAAAGTPLRNVQWEAFAVAYVKLGGDASKAYRETYPRCRKWKEESVWVRACRLLANAKVKPRVQQIQAELSAKGIATAEEVARFLSMVLRADESLQTPCFDKQGATVINPRTEKPLMVGPPLRTRIAAASNLSKLMGYNKPIDINVHRGPDVPPEDAEVNARLSKYVAEESGATE